MPTTLAIEEPQGVALYAWDRIWHSVPGQVFVDGRGFYAPVLNWSSADRTVGTLDTYRHLRCLLLSGPAGSGKSIALWQEQQRAEGAGEVFRSMNLQGLTSVQDLRKEFEQLDESLELLLVDAVDEGMLAIPHLVSELGRQMEALEAKPGRNHKVRIAIRSGTPCTPLRQKLGQVFGSSFRELTLAPLSQAQIEAAVDAEHLDSNRFIVALDTFQAGPLAAQPITLGMLIRQWRSIGRLPASRTILYLNACKALSSEHSENRAASGQGVSVFAGSLDPAERLAIAERLAALMVFSHKTTLDLSSKPGLISDPECLACGDAVGSERDGQREIRVNEAAVWEVAATSLFVPSGRDRYVFAHRSFAEFLAARYATRRLTRIQGASLLRSGSSNGAPLITPGLRGAASWMAALDSDWFDWLLDIAPGILLRSGVPAASTGKRARLAQALIDRSYNGAGAEADDCGRDLDLVLVNHPGIADQIRPLLVDHKARPEQRQLALEMACQCGLTEIASDLVEIALDPKQGNFRCMAMSALRHFPERFRGPLVAVALRGAVQDPEEDLRGLALTLVWPSHVTIPQMIGALVPKWSGNPFGPYQAFVSMIVPARLKDNELPEMLAALSLRTAQPLLKREDNRPFTLLIQYTLKRSLSLLDTDAIRSAVAELIFNIPLSVDWDSWSDFLANRGPPAGFNDGLRRMLVMDLIELGENSIVRRLLETPWFLFENDLPWLIDAYRCETERTRRTALATLAVEVARYPGSIVFSVLRYFGANEAVAFALISESEELAPYKRWRPDVPPEDSVEEDDDSSAEEIVACAQRHLASVADDPQRAWALLVRDLAQRPTDDPHSILVDFEETRCDSLIGLPGFVHLPRADHARLALAASAYLEAGDPGVEPPNGWWSGSTDLTFKAIAGPLAMSELLGRDPSVLHTYGEVIWAKWTPAFMAYPWSSKSPNSPFGKLLDFLAKHTPVQCAEAIRNAAGHRSEALTVSLSRALIDEVGGCWVPPVRDVLAEIVALGSEGQAQNYSLAAAILLTKRDPVGLELAERAVNGRFRGRHHFDPHGAAAVLLCDWHRYWSCIDAYTDKSAMRQILNAAAALAASDESRIDVFGLDYAHSLAGLFSALADWEESASDAACKPDRQAVFERIVLNIADFGANGRTILNQLSSKLPAFRELIERELLRIGVEDGSFGYPFPTPAEILELTESREVRLLRSESDLLALVEESLGRLQRMWQSETPTVRMLWNEIGPMTSGNWTHKGENFFSDIIKQHLELDLRGVGLIANREVEIRATGGSLSGERTDIQVEALLTDPLRPKQNTIAKIIIEVKGCWNDGLLDSMKLQLRDRYLSTTGCRTGLYVVGWFACAAWKSAQVNGHRQRPDETLQNIRVQLDEQAKQLSSDGRRLAALVLDACP